MSNAAPRIAVHIFGGSFNPPHLAHVLGVCLGKCMVPSAKTVVIPAFQHPFAKALAPFEARVQMCKEAFAWVPDTEVSRVEEFLGGESRTLRTLRHLAAENPHWDMRLLVGADILAEAAKWFGWSEIIALAPPLVLGRAGTAATADAPQPLLPAISSTQIRDALASSNPSSAHGYLPPAVRAYIEARNLYRGQPS
jgi:nicotinate-nucleotide adenylyltransferase